MPNKVYLLDEANELYRRTACATAQERCLHQRLGRGRGTLAVALIPFLSFFFFSFFLLSPHKIMPVHQPVWGARLTERYRFGLSLPCSLQRAALNLSCDLEFVLYHPEMTGTCLLHSCGRRLSCTCDCNSKSLLTPSRPALDRCGTF